MHKVTQEKRYYRLDFPTWSDFIDHVRDLTGTKVDESKKYDTSGWSGTVTWDEAIDLATSTDWKEGIELAHKVMDPLINRISSMIEVDSIIYDVEGMHVDMGAYMTGEPECWQRTEPSIEEGVGTRVHRLVFCSSACAAISKDSIIRKGALIAALVNLMELGGHRVELILSMADRGGYGDTEHYSDFYVTLKQAQQPLDFNRIVFALAHPAMIRRFRFRLMEDMPKAFQEAFSVGHGYGRPHEPRDKGDLFFESMPFDKLEVSNDLNKQQEIILKTLAAQGIHVSGLGGTHAKTS